MVRSSSTGRMYTRDLLEPWYGFWYCVVLMPAANAVLLDTDPLPAGDYDIFFALAPADTAAAGRSMQLTHMLAAPGGNRYVLSAAVPPVAITGYLYHHTFAPDEYLRMNSGAASGTASFYIGSLGVRRVT